LTETEAPVGPDSRSTVKGDASTSGTSWQCMGHSPRKLLPVFYGSQMTFSRGTIPRTRSLGTSPSHSPTRRGFGNQHFGGSSGMHVLRWLVMLGMCLLLMSLMYVQVSKVM
jgi:hypothetical protein